MVKIMVIKWSNNGPPLGTFVCSTAGLGTVPMSDTTLTGHLGTHPSEWSNNGHIMVK